MVRVQTLLQLCAPALRRCCAGLHMGVGGGGGGGALLHGEFFFRAKCVCKVKVGLVKRHVYTTILATLVWWAWFHTSMN